MFFRPYLSVTSGLLAVGLSLGSAQAMPPSPSASKVKSEKATVRPKAPPSPTSISFDDDEVMGNPEATVALIEFSDFQAFANFIDSLLKEGPKQE